MKYTKKLLRKIGNSIPGSSIFLDPKNFDLSWAAESRNSDRDTLHRTSTEGPVNCDDVVVTCTNRLCTSERERVCYCSRRIHDVEAFSPSLKARQCRRDEHANNRERDGELYQGNARSVIAVQLSFLAKILQRVDGM